LQAYRGRRCIENQQIGSSVIRPLRLHVGGDQKIMKPIVVGILPQECIRERIRVIALGGACKPKATEAKVWFTSVRSLVEVLSE
jgi:predicted transcriptional regulator